MPSYRQQQRDAVARSKGFRNYTDYRNHLAREQGYRNYTEQRRARKTGIGLRGSDKARLLSPAETEHRSRRALESFQPLPNTAQPNMPSVRRAIPDRPSAATRVDASHYFNKAIYDVKAKDRDLKSLLNRFAIQPKNDVGRMQGRNNPLLQNAMMNDARSRLKETFLTTKAYYDQVLPDLYKEGAASILGPGKKLSGSELKRIQALQAQGLKDAQRAILGAERGFKKRMSEIVDMPTDKAIIYIKGKPIQAVAYGDGYFRSMSTYIEASMRSISMRAYNEATVQAALSKGFRAFQIADGPDCGLSSHGNQPMAHGMIVSAETALEYPISHPNCIRTFTPTNRTPEDDDDLKDRIKEGLKKQTLGEMVARGAVETAKASAVSSIVGTIVNTSIEYARRTDLTSRLAARAVESVPGARVFAQRMGIISDDMEVPVARLADDISTYEDDYAAGRALPAHVRAAIGVVEEAPRKVVGDAYELWHDWYDRYRFTNISSVNLAERGLTEAAKDQAFGAFFNIVTRNRFNNRFIRFSAPDLGGKVGGETTMDILLRKRAEARMSQIEFARYKKQQEKRRVKRGAVSPFPHRMPRMTLDLGMFRMTTTRRGAKDFINHFNLNPHGLLRAGFAKDKAGYIIPTFRLVPPGPIRISTRVNRGIKGNITSLSVNAYIITPKHVLRRANEWLGITDHNLIRQYLGSVGLNFSAGINVNLRQLGLSNFREIKNLTVDDWKALRLRAYYNQVTGEFEERPQVILNSLGTSVGFTGGTALRQYENFVDRITRHPLVELVEYITERRMDGWRLFDLMHTFRIDGDTAMKLWQLTSLEIQTLDKTREYLAKRNKQRIYQIEEAVHPFTRKETKMGKRIARQGNLFEIRGFEQLGKVPPEILRQYGLESPKELSRRTSQPPRRPRKG